MNTPQKLLTIISLGSALCFGACKDESQKAVALRKAILSNKQTEELRVNLIILSAGIDSITPASSIGLNENIQTITQKPVHDTVSKKSSNKRDLGSAD